MSASRRMVSSKSNSGCDTAKLHELDFSTWWTDELNGELYLHVRRPSDETTHRVYCKHPGRYRLAMQDDVLFWLIDRKRRCRMIVRTNEERDASVKAVESWLWHQGEMPSHEDIATCVAWWVENWDREKNNGLDVLADMYAERIYEFASVLKGI